MSTTFKDQKIIIAGGSSGIGLAAALQFQELGGSVTVTGRNPDKLKSAQQYSLNTVALDSTDRVALDRFFAGFGQADHLVVSLSGHKGMGNFDTLSLEVLREGFEQKFWPVLHTVQAALPYIKKGGSITIISAISAIAKLSGTSGLGAINGALEIMVQVWAKEFDGIRINAVSPGIVDTNWWDFMSPEDKAQTFEQFIPNIKAGRVANAQEIAQAVLFVSGNGYMTGKVIGIDGGLF